MKVGAQIVVRWKIAFSAAMLRSGRKALQAAHTHSRPIIGRGGRAVQVASVSDLIMADLVFRGSDDAFCLVVGEVPGGVLLLCKEILVGEKRRFEPSQGVSSECHVKHIATSLVSHAACHCDLGSETGNSDRDGPYHFAISSDAKQRSVRVDVDTAQLCRVGPRDD